MVEKMFKNNIMAMVFGGLLVPSGLCAMDGREQPVEEETKEAAAEQELTPAERRALLTLDQREEIDQELIRLVSLPENVRNQMKGVLERGADVNACNERGMSALEIAIEHRNGRAAQVLLNFGANATQAYRVIVKQMGKNEKLIRAAESNNKEVVIDTLVAGADIDAFGLYEETPLTVAIGKGDGDMVALLLHHDATVNRPDGTLLDQPLDDAMYAMSKSGVHTRSYYSDIIRQLIVAGAQVDPDTMNDSDKKRFLRFQEDPLMAQVIQESFDIKKMLDAQDWAKKKVSEYFEGFLFLKGTYFDEVVKCEIKRRQRQGKVKELVLFYIPVKELSRLVGDYVGFYNNRLVESTVVAEEEIKEETEDGVAAGTRAAERALVAAERIAVAIAPSQSNAVEAEEEIREEAEDEVACFNCTALNNTRDYYCTVCRAPVPDKNGFF